MRITSKASLIVASGILSVAGVSAQGANIALNTGGDWAAYGDVQAASSNMTSHSNTGWAYDGNEGSFPWISGPTVSESPILNPPHWTYTTWDVDATIDSVTVKVYKDGDYTTQEFQIQSLNSGGDPNDDSDWTTVFTVSDVGVGSGPEPYINDASFTYTPGSSITTRGIRTLITVPSEFWQDNTFVEESGAERARIDEIIVNGTVPAVPEPTAMAVIGGAVLLLGRRRRRMA